MGAGSSGFFLSCLSSCLCFFLSSFLSFFDFDFAVLTLLVLLARLRDFPIFLPVLLGSFAGFGGGGFF